MPDTKLIALQLPEDDDRPAFRAVRHFDNHVEEVPASQAAFTVEANGWRVTFEYCGRMSQGVDEKGDFYHFRPKMWQPLD